MQRSEYDYRFFGGGGGGGGGVFPFFLVAAPGGRLPVVFGCLRIGGGGGAVGARPGSSLRRGTSGRLPPGAE